MRSIIPWTILLVMTACSRPPGSDSEPVTTATAASETDPTDVKALPDSAVRHVVIFKYRSGADEGEIAQVTNAFRALQNSVPGILAFEHGVNNSPEDLNLGFTHAFTLTFEDAAARDAYLPHPEHEAFGDLLTELGVVEEVFVVDYVPSP